MISTDLISPSARNTAETSLQLTLYSVSNVLVPSTSCVQKTEFTIEIPLDEAVEAVRKVMHKDCTSSFEHVQASLHLVSYLIQIE